MISFKNRGLIEMTAVTTFGVSAKESKSPIGFFGTGLKYAIAVILRNGGSIRIWRGLQTYYQFEVELEEIRGKEFGIVHMSQFNLLEYAEVRLAQTTPLGFTTHLGVNWEPWQAFREIYCNMLDEGGEASTERMNPEEDCTLVEVSGFAAFEQAYTNRREIVLQGDPWVVLDGVEVHDRPSSYLYYRGIRAHKLDRPSKLTYNITSPCELTEDRTLKYSWQHTGAIASGILKSHHERFLREVLTVTERDLYEHSIQYSNMSLAPTEEFLSVAHSMGHSLITHGNHDILKVVRKYSERKLEMPTVGLTESEINQLEKAQKLLQLMGYMLPSPTIEVEFCETLGPGVLGQADVTERIIRISRRAFDQGLTILAGTLLEEYLHIEHQFVDETRDFQNYLLDKLIRTSVGLYLQGEAS